MQDLCKVFILFLRLTKEPLDAPFEVSNPPVWGLNSAPLVSFWMKVVLKEPLVEISFDNELPLGQGCIDFLWFSDFGGYVLEMLANYSSVDYKADIIFGKVSIRYVFGSLLSSEETG